MQRVRHKFSVSERRACKGLKLPRSSVRYRRRIRSDEPALRRRMLELARKRPYFGYRQITRLLRQEGFRVNFKRVYRLWRQEGLRVPKKMRKKRSLGTGRNACHRLRAERMNHVWAWDFIFDRTASGQTLKWFTVVDEYTRRCITLDVSRSMQAEDVIDRLAELFVMHGVPECIRSDNGPEFIATEIRRWLGQIGVQTLYIEPGSPWENGYAESFHSRLRAELLNVEEFDNVRHAREHARAWQEDYNDYRPHSSLDGQTPSQFARRCAASGRATPSLQQHSEPVPVTQPQLS